MAGKLHRVLLADDGSEHARAGCQLLAALPLSSDAEVVALRVFIPLQAAEHARFEEQLQKTVAYLAENGIEARSELLLGYPADKILEYAAVFHPDLIVMGAKGLRSVFSLGSVAAHVVEEGGWPVLVARAPYRELRHIVLALDDSASSQAAEDFVRQFPWPNNVRVTVLHVIAPPPLELIYDPLMMTNVDYYAVQMLDEEEQRRRAEAHARAEDLLHKAVTRLQAAGLEARSHIMLGDAAAKIIEYVQREPVDLIVVADQGKSSLRAWLLGSVARQLMTHAPISVLVVRGKR